MANPAKSLIPSHYRVLLLLAILAFIILRLLGWMNAPELENHDSVSYLRWAEIFGSGSWHAIVNLEPDAAVFYPLLSALAALLPGDIEVAARLVSFLSSLAIMSAAFLLVKRIDGYLAGIVAVLILAVSPQFFRMSYSVLTEPLYIALFSGIVLVFISTVENPSIRSGAVLGVLAGLAFLTRVEAILLIAALPALHGLYILLKKPGKPLKTVVYSNVALVLVMALIALPQIVRVSVLMNSFALNGRDAWTLILSNPDGKSYNEKLWGLDYDPTVKNLDYLQKNPQVLGGLVTSSGGMAYLKEYLRTAVRNLRIMHDSQLVLLIGLPVLAFSVVGFLAMLEAGRGADASLLLAFTGIALVAPVFYHVTFRHLLILVPLVTVFAASGVIKATHVIASALAARKSRHGLILTALVLLLSVIPLGETLGFIVKKDDENHEYDLDAIREPVAIVKEMSEKLDSRPVIISRKSYLAWFSGATFDLIPYTDAAGLFRYIDAHEVDFLYFNEDLLHGFPFVNELDSEDWNRHLHKVWSRDTPDGMQVLYTVRSADGV